MVLSSISGTPNFTTAARSGLALVAIGRGDSAAASEHYTALESRQGTMAFYFKAIDRLLGLLSVTIEQLDQAVGHFENALAFCRKAGFRPELAWTCHDYAEALLERNGDGDRSKAISLLEESLAISTDLGMRPLMERVTVLQEKTATTPAKAPALPDGLTQREVEVLRLLTNGKTDREIAEELLISARTVGHHISNILNKTNTSNRTEAAIYASQHGLTP